MSSGIIVLLSIAMRARVSTKLLHFQFCVHGSIPCKVWRAEAVEVGPLSMLQNAMLRIGTLSSQENRRIGKWGAGGWGQYKQIPTSKNFYPSSELMDVLHSFLSPQIAHWSIGVHGAGLKAKDPSPKARAGPKESRTQGPKSMAQNLRAPCTRAHSLRLCTSATA